MGCVLLTPVFISRYFYLSNNIRKDCISHSKKIMKLVLSKVRMPTSQIITSLSIRVLVTTAKKMQKNSKKGQKYP